MTIPEKTIKALREMVAIQAMIEGQEVTDENEHAFERYSVLLKQVTPVLTPLVDLLASAGVFTLDVGLTPENLADINNPQYGRVQFECKAVYLNGSFWLEGSECMGGVYRPGMGGDPARN